MIQLHLAERNFIKAATVVETKGRGKDGQDEDPLCPLPDAVPDWVPRAVTDAGQWGILAKIMQSQGVDGEAHAVDSKLLQAAALAMRCWDKATEAEELQKEMAACFETLRTKFRGQVYTAPQLASFVRTLVAFAHPHRDLDGFLRNAFGAVAQGIRASGRNSQKQLFELGLPLLDDILRLHHAVSNKAALRESIEDVLCALAFSSPPEWLEFFGVSQGERKPRGKKEAAGDEEGASEKGEGGQDEGKGEEEEDEEEGQVFDRLVSPEWGWRALCRAEAKDCKGRKAVLVQLFERLASSPVNMARVVLLRCFCKRMKEIAPPVEKGGGYDFTVPLVFKFAAVVVKTLIHTTRYDELKEVVLQLDQHGAYHSQSDSLFYNGVGFQVLSAVAHTLAKAATRAAAQVVSCATTLCRMYHKLVEPHLSVLLPCAVEVEEGRAFVTACMEEFVKLQAIDEVLPPLLSTPMPSGPPAWLADLYVLHLPRIIDPITALKASFENVDFLSSFPGSAKHLSALLSCIVVQESSTTTAVHWIDTMTKEVLSPMLKKAWKRVEKAPEKFLAAAHLYWVLQLQLDRIAPNLLSDIFQWSEQITGALRLIDGVPKKAAVGDLPLIYSEELSFTHADISPHDKGAVTLRLLHQRLCRVYQQYHITQWLPEPPKDKLAVLKRQLKVGATELLRIAALRLCEAQDSPSDQDIDTLSLDLSPMGGVVQSLSALLRSLHWLPTYAEEGVLDDFVRELVSASPPFARVAPNAQGATPHDMLWDALGEQQTAPLPHQPPLERRATLTAHLLVIISSPAVWDNANFSSAVLRVVTTLLGEENTPPSLLDSTLLWLQMCPQRVLETLAVGDEGHALRTAVSYACDRCAMESDAALVLKEQLGRLVSCASCDVTTKQLLKYVKQCRGVPQRAVAAVVRTVHGLLPSVPRDELKAYCGETLYPYLLKHSDEPMAANTLAMALTELAGVHPFPLDPSDIQATRTKRRKRNRDDEDSEALAKRLLDTPLVASHPVLLGAVLLLRRQHGALAADEADEAAGKVMVHLRAAPTAKSTGWLLAVALETVIPSLAKPSGFFSKAHATVGLVQGAVGWDMVQLRENADENKAALVLFQRLSVLHPTKRAKLLRKVLVTCGPPFDAFVVSGGNETNEVAAAANTLRCLVVACPQDTNLVKEELGTVFVKAFGALHLTAVRGGLFDGDTASTLGALASVICLMEKVTLPRDAIPLLLTV
eukprot:Sspe_Gene.56079::Locus_30847_Transcript_1_1_Confidence_1.000_Length_3775::g.56079::m.56079